VSKRVAVLDADTGRFKRYTRRHPTFRFHRADLASSAYNPHGLMPASAYRFPFPDQSFDFIFLTVVPDANH
jgi:hypothetical protein